jgi:hypothetical protein
VPRRLCACCVYRPLFKNDGITFSLIVYLRVHPNMKFMISSVMFASLLSSASAFGVRQPLARRAFTSATKPLQANVLRLSDPQSQLLDKVDVFIFDCDGVIWRVGL